MRTLTTEAEIQANGSVRLLTPLPSWVKPGRARVSLLVEETGESPAKSPRARLTADPGMVARRKAALAEIRRLNPYRDITDPVVWQQEIRAERPLPFHG